MGDRVRGVESQSQERTADIREEVISSQRFPSELVRIPALAGNQRI